MTYFRWNSSFDLLDCINDLQEPLVQTLSKVNTGVEFRLRDWDLIKLVVGVLKPFKDATEMLSHRDASISMAIPIVTTIMKGLETTAADQGVKTMKRDLQKSMEERFAGIEEIFDFSASTLLDAKFKKTLFRDPNAVERTKNFLLDKMVLMLQREVCAL